MRRVFLCSVAVAVMSAPASAQWPDALTAALNVTDAGPQYAFDVEHVSEQIGEDETETISAYARVDPSQEELKQITPAHLLNGDKPGSSFRALADLENIVEDGIWCSRFVDEVPEDVEVIDETATSLTVEFEPLPPPEAEGPQKKIAKRTRARMTVSKTTPGILSYERVLTKTVSMFVVAKIRQADSKITCEQAPDGRTYAANVWQAFEFSGGGQSGTNQSETRITALYDLESGTALTTAAR